LTDNSTWSASGVNVTSTDNRQWKAPEISLPKGGGAIRGIGEKFTASSVTGTGALSVPIACSPSRAKFDPDLTLNYDSGFGDGPFGVGWSLDVPKITRRTDKGLPRYREDQQTEADIFLISGQEDLVPVLRPERDGRWRRPPKDKRDGYTIEAFRPRTEGLFARIERWTSDFDGAEHWRSISKDNVSTLYGVDDNSRIADPATPRRVFSWLMSASFDGKGNAILYDYTPENDFGVDLRLPSERHRRRGANRYLRSVRYGNRIPLRIEDVASAIGRPRLDPVTLDRARWMFSVVFDYGEGRYREEPRDAEGRVFAHAEAVARQHWPARADPFSTYRSCFEIRTYRLCKRAMMFHHFPEELGVDDCLVRSTGFAYREGRDGSFLERVTQTGHRLQTDGRYLTRALPPLDLSYSRSPLEARRPDGLNLVEVDPSLANLPGGLDGERYRWLDLNGEGIAGVFAEQGGAWFYKRNLGQGRFGATEAVRTSPVDPRLDIDRRQLLDVVGDGNLDLVDFSPSSPGYYERTREAGWSGFRAFRLTPNLNWADPNLRFVDLTGDGVADILITEQEALVWHPSLLEAGFGAGLRLRVPYEEEAGPSVIFADGTQSIYLADMSGDGLSDIVRIRNGEVCYWPNLGYGRFDAKVAMDDAPRFDAPDLFDQKRIRLADTDGSGTTDIVYLGAEGADVYLNLAGNGWSEARRIDNFPPIDDLAAVSVMDFLGRGTACLVWSSPLPAEAGRQIRYIDLMRGFKPFLLTTIKNNLGAETKIEYASSTEFYLADAAVGTPWITRLPFPVHVVRRVETKDLVSGNRFVSRYSYHHGFYDGLEREFRGFARVDRWDVEDIPSLVGEMPAPSDADAPFRASGPPVLTKTWLHTGVYLAGELVSRQLAREYYGSGARAGESDCDDPLDDTILPEGLTPFEAREACRALKGSILRREIYALDDTVKAGAPYSIAESNFTLVPLQPKEDNLYAVFFTHPREVVTYDCEREPQDPRVSHAVTLAVDDYGNVLKSAAIGYGRRASPFAEQIQTSTTLAENHFTNVVWEANAYRTPAPAAAKTYQLTAPQIAGSRRLSFAVIRALASQATEIPYEASPDPGKTQKRLIENMRIQYRRDDFTGLLPVGALQSLALPGESFRQSLTAGLLDLFAAKASADELMAILNRRETGYRDLEGDGPFWIPSGRIYYSPYEEEAVAEHAFARTHFFLPYRYEDPFGETTRIGYDAHDLAPTSSRDPVGNEVHARLDYRVLLAKEIVDPNGNRSGARFDALGRLTGTVVQGKADGPIEGDNFGDFVDDISPIAIKRFFKVHDPRALARAHLGSATKRLLYDLDCEPVCAATIARETHVSDLAPGQETRLQMRFDYSDGFGRIAQTKMQAEPGPLRLDDPEATISNPRWVGTGATIYNDRGKPVRQYEPFFCPDPHFGIERWGVSNMLFYDPMQRVVATLHPNATYEKVVFDSWRQTTFDVNDTVTFDPARDPDVAVFFRRLPTADYAPTWYQQRIGGDLGAAEQMAAEKAAKCADTPTLAHLDSLGRPFLKVANNGRDERGREQLYRTFSILDIEGNQRAVIDALDRVVMRYDYEMSGMRLRQASMEAGARSTLNDVLGKPIRGWNSRNYAFRTEYDALRRPTRSFVRGGDPSEQRSEIFERDILFERTIYGDSADTGLTKAQQNEANLRGKVFRHFDGAGIIATGLYDFKGNSLSIERRLTRNYKLTPDWSRDPGLESEVLASSSVFDALNRAIAVTAPDRSVYRPTFNEASLLERVDVNLRGAHRHDEPVWTRFIEHIGYDAKSQRASLRYGNGAMSTYVYDEKTFRLVRLTTTRATRRDEVATRIFRDAAVVQDLRHTYDPVGNITRIEDGALRTMFHANHRVEAACDYTYDPLYRLTEASGREHIGQSAFDFVPKDGDNRDYPFVGAADLRDLEAISAYVERYDYDSVGNFHTLRHQAAYRTWARHYSYDETSLTEPAHTSNRLSRTDLRTPDGPITEPYAYDAHGNVTAMPHLPTMGWSFRDALSNTSRQHRGGGAAEMCYYVYDVGGQRTRKVTERRNGSRKTERLYVGGFELYREFDAHGAPTFERQTLHVMDDKQRIALVETATRAEGAEIADPKAVLRYQLGNHLGSACLELDTSGKLISYEEYSPYGTSVFQASRGTAEVSMKRYRYTGKERDTENGFTYHGARYCAPWLGRWTSCDPAGFSDGTNLYLYARDNPVVNTDLTGACCDPSTQSCVESTQPTVREEALQQSLPEDERYLPAASSSAPPPPSSAPPRPGAIAPPPPVSPTDYSLYVPQGFVYSQREAAIREADDPDNSWYVRATMFVLGTAATPLALAEEYIARPIANVPFAMQNAGIGIGEHIGRGYLWSQQGEQGEAAVEGLEAVKSFSQGFVAGASVGAPIAGALESRAVGTTTAVVGKNLASRGTGAFIEGVGGGEGLGKLADKAIQVSEKGLAIVEEHLAQFGPVPENTAMIGRLRSALSAGERISGADASFYMHEVSEATMMGRGMSYEAAHATALAKYGVSPYSVYHPEVIQSLPSSFNANWLKFWGLL
jgi:RHS repeat-associated protein